MVYICSLSVEARYALATAPLPTVPCTVWPPIHFCPCIDPGTPTSTTPAPVPLPVLRPSTPLEAPLPSSPLRLPCRRLPPHPAVCIFAPQERLPATRTPEPPSCTAGPQPPGRMPAIGLQLPAVAGGSGSPHPCRHPDAGDSHSRRSHPGAGDDCRRRRKPTAVATAGADSRPRQPAACGSRRPRRPPGVATALGDGGSIRREGALQGLSWERCRWGSDSGVRGRVPAAASSRAAAAAGRRGTCKKHKKLWNPWRSIYFRIRLCSDLPPRSI